MPTSTSISSITASVQKQAGSTSSTYLSLITTVSTPELSTSFTYAENVTEITEAAKCWSSLSSWYLKSVSWYNKQVANTTYPLTNTSVSLVYPWFLRQDTIRVPMCRITSSAMALHVLIYLLPPSTTAASRQTGPPLLSRIYRHRSRNSRVHLPESSAGSGTMTQTSTTPV